MAKKYGGTGTVMNGSIGYEDAFDVEQTTDGGYIVAGSTSSNDGDVSGLHLAGGSIASAQDYWIVKLNDNGDLQWQKCLGEAMVMKLTVLNKLWTGGML